jgi:hypothetical protein
MMGERGEEEMMLKLKRRRKQKQDKTGGGATIRRIRDPNNPIFAGKGL